MEASASLSSVSSNISILSSSSASSSTSSSISDTISPNSITWVEPPLAPETFLPPPGSRLNLSGLPDDLFDSGMHPSYKNEIREIMANGTRTRKRKLSVKAAEKEANATTMAPSKRIKLDSTDDHAKSDSSSSSNKSDKRKVSPKSKLQPRTKPRGNHAKGPGSHTSPSPSPPIPVPSTFPESSSLSPPLHLPAPQPNSVTTALEVKAPGCDIHDRLAVKQQEVHREYITRMRATRSQRKQGEKV